MPNILAKDVGRAIFWDSLEDGFFFGRGSGLADEILKISSFMITLKCIQVIRCVVTEVGQLLCDTDAFHIYLMEGLISKFS